MRNKVKDDKGRQKYVASVYEARDLAREQIFEIEYQCPPTDSALLDEYGGGRSARKTRYHSHAAVMLFYRELRPYHAHVNPRIWKEPLADVRVPYRQELTGAKRTTDGWNLAPADVSTRTETVSLETLDNWRMRYVVFQVRDTARHRGEIQDVIRRRLLLTPSAILGVYDQLNEVLNNVGLMPEVSEIPATDEPPEPPAHVVENAPAYQQEDGD